MKSMADHAGSEKIVTFAAFVSSAFSPLAAVVSGLRADPAADNEKVAALEGSLLFARMRMEQMTTVLNGGYLLKLAHGVYAESIPDAALSIKDMEDEQCK